MTHTTWNPTISLFFNQKYLALICSRECQFDQNNVTSVLYSALCCQFDKRLVKSEGGVLTGKTLLAAQEAS